MQYLKLNNDYQIPLLGFGTYLITDTNENEEDNKKAKDALIHAFRVGYRHIDTALYYKNHKLIGDVISEININRKEMFITSKFTPINKNLSIKEVASIINQHLKKLRIDYLDLYLIHWPLTKSYNLQLWKILEVLYEKEIIKSIGVSNFVEEDLDHLITNAKIKPQMNQILISPYDYSRNLVNYCQKQNIAVTGYSTLKFGILNDPIIKEIAIKKGVTPAQIILRWGIQQNIIMIAKSITFRRIESNFDVFSFQLSDQEIEIISNLE